MLDQDIDVIRGLGFEIWIADGNKDGVDRIIDGGGYSDILGIRA